MENGDDPSVSVSLAVLGFLGAESQVQQLHQGEMVVEE
jgi:hypothetical protein